MGGEKVYFYSEGLKLEGLLYKQSSSEPRPGIVVCQGFGGVKETTAAPICEFLNSKGYVTLCLDYRYWGASEGDPRGRVVPLDQVQDIRNAMTFLQQQPGVDSDKIGLYGSSYGGADVIYISAIDKRSKCTVATVPVANTLEWLRSIRAHWEWVQLMNDVAQNRVQMVLTGESKYVDRSYIMTSDPDTAEFVKNAPPTSMSLESVEHLIAFNPEEYIDKVAPCPLQIIYSEKDILVNPEQQIRAFGKANEPKRLCMLKGAKHFDVYNARFEETMKHTFEWFNQWLPVE